MKTILCLTTLFALGLISTTTWCNAPSAPRRAAVLKPCSAKLKPFDTNQDGSITIEEMTDARLKPLLQRADANGDGAVNVAELTALFEKESSNQRGGFGGGPGFGPPEGFGPGPGGPPPGGFPGGPGEMGPPPGKVGEVMPSFLADELELTAEQKRQIEALQKMVDGRLRRILNRQQRAELQQMSQPGPGPGGPPPRN